MKNALLIVAGLLAYYLASQFFEEIMLWID